MPDSYTQLQKEALEVLEILEDSVEHLCRENQISGEKVWHMIQELSRIKCQQFPQHEED